MGSRPSTASLVPTLAMAQAGDSLALRLRLLVGHDSVLGFARRMGLRESLVRKYLLGSKPGADKLQVIAEKTGCSVDWLLFGTGEMYANPEMDPRRMEDEEPVELERPDWIYLPLYDIAAGAGYGTFVDEPEEAVEEVIGFSQLWIRRMFSTSPEGLSLIHVRGESMEPTLRSGDIILVDTKVNEPREGISVLRLDGTVLVKRVMVRPGKRLEIISDNSAYKPFKVDLRDPPEDFAVLGRVLWSFREH